MNREQISAFLVRCSFNGLLALYAATISSVEKKAFLYKELFKDSLPDYSYGYLVACHSVGLFELTTNKGMCNASNCNIYLTELVLDELKKRAEHHDATYPNELAWGYKIGGIANYFK